MHCVALVIHDDDNDELTPRKRQRSRTEDDDLWMPGGIAMHGTLLLCHGHTAAGTVKLLSGSIASGSRPARHHARKFSAEKMMVKKPLGAKLARRHRYSLEEKPDIKHLVWRYLLVHGIHSFGATYRRVCMPPQ